MDSTAHRDAPASAETETTSIPNLEKTTMTAGAETANSGTTSTELTVKEAEAERQIPETFKPDWRVRVAFASMTVLTLMASLDATSLSVALPIIADAIRGTAIQAFWSGTSFLLSSTVFQPVIGAFSHIFGRKPLVIFSLICFLAGSIVAALAKNMAMMLVGRTLQGVGGGGIITLTSIIITDLVPLRFRGNFFSVISMMWALGSVTGPILGGGFSENASWRWIFWINLPFIGIGGTMVILFLTVQFPEGSFAEKLARVDWIGTVMFIGSLTGFLIPLTWGGVMYPWDHWRTLVPLIVSAVGLIAFVVYEVYVAKEPIIRTRLFRQRTFSITCFGSFVHGMCLWSILYYLPLYYEAVKGYTPIISGVALFPETFTVAPAGIFVGATITKTGKYRMMIWIGWFLTVFGTGLLIYMDVGTSIAQWIFLNLVPGLGLGILYPALAFGVQAASSNADMAFAVTTFAFFRAFGQAVGVAVGGVIFQNKIKSRLMQYQLLRANAADYARDSSALVQIIKAFPPSPIRTQLVESYAYALKFVWIFLCALAAVAAVVSLFTEELSLDRKHETEQGFVQKSRDADNEMKNVTSTQST